MCENKGNPEKYFSITGYWCDDGSLIDSIVTDFDGDTENYKYDHMIFWYGISEEQIKYHIETKEPVSKEYIITSYEPIEL